MPSSPACGSAGRIQIRKAIKLTLQDDADPRYRRLLDGLMAIYREARAIRTDATLDDAAKLARVTRLEDELGRLCYGEILPDARRGLEHDYALSAHEVVRPMDNKSLFTFVTAVPPAQPNGAALPVGGTNNEAERTLRGAAEARKTCRTSKTAAGTRRRAIIVSVLESLRLYLPELLRGATGEAEVGTAERIDSRSTLPDAPAERLDAFTARRDSKMLISRSCCKLYERSSESPRCAVRDSKPEVYRWRSGKRSDRDYDNVAGYG